MIAKKLQIGDTIGLVSPASPEEFGSIKKGISFLKSLGFNVKEGKHIYDKLGYFAGNDKDRAEDLMNMFIDKTITMILCVRGGYGCMRLLPLLDYDIIKDNPKIFMGFSDITTLLNTLSSKCGFITFHGPMGSSNLEDEETFKSFLNTITKCNRPYALDTWTKAPIDYVNKGCAQGKLVGGNLSLIISTLGTPYEIDTKDNILFIEDVKEPPYSIDRMLTQLHLSGKLKECRGVIIGQFTDCTLSDYTKSLNLEQILEDRILSLNKPTVLNFMSGHDYPKLTLPIGAKAKINCDKKSLEILEAVVK
ncbi:S66 peptidase family protein [Clostridium brassicae]|uniref:LD-carboxypeptidase n=1 Tax=Clostridium brassicae TaxID=2999072 RepID=A0ABT4DHG0_9CLOT|nr:LD-carboxypeptidase [Clostridium brassicae]MCY6960636.1 LD-carboxypeptidase [Clostridium brassicae]